MSNDVFRAEGQSPPEPPYEARFGPAWREVLVLGALLVLLLIALDTESSVSPSFSYWLTVVFVVGIGVQLVIRVVHLGMERVVLRVDTTGVRLGTWLPLPPSWDKVVPWAEVDGVYIWRPRGSMPGRVRVVGVERRGHDRDPSPLRRYAMWASMPERVPRQVYYHRRYVADWRLDREALAAAVARHAPPTVPVVDLS